jgi:hypothetical protein
MKRVTIKNLQGIITHQGQMEDPTQWIADCVQNNSWGLGLRKAWKNALSQSEIALIVSEEEIEIVPMIPANPNAEPPTEEIPAVFRTQVTLKAMYTITIEDMQAEIDAENIKKAQLAALKTRIRSLGDLSDLTAAELKEAVIKLVKFLIGSNKLD